MQLVNDNSVVRKEETCYKCKSVVILEGQENEQNWTCPACGAENKNTTYWKARKGFYAGLKSFLKSYFSASWN